MLTLILYCCWQPWSDQLLIAVGSSNCRLITDCWVRIIDSGMLSYKVDTNINPFPKDQETPWKKGRKSQGREGEWCGMSAARNVMATLTQGSCAFLY